MLFSSVFAITERRDMGLYEVRGALVDVFVGFWDGDYVSQLPYMYYVFLRAVLNILVRNASPRGPVFQVPDV